MIDWPDIDIVMLDMDGTLLDLHFDNFFWLEYVPRQYATMKGISEQEAKTEVYPRFAAAEGTMDWYCVDYWTAELGLDIEALKVEIKHRISVLPHVEEFLKQVRASGRRLLLVTNAHQKSLRLKLTHTGIGEYFDEIICSHAYGMPKEDQQFWHNLHRHIPFENNKTLLVDDSLPVLRSAREYGIAHLLSVQQPDTQRPRKSIDDFDAITDFNDIMPQKLGVLL